jgi:hypothetical protein
MPVPAVPLARGAGLLLRAAGGEPGRLLDGLSPVTAPVAAG